MIDLSCHTDFLPFSWYITITAKTWINHREIGIGDWHAFIFSRLKCICIHVGIGRFCAVWVWVPCKQLMSQIGLGEVAWCGLWRWACSTQPFLTRFKPRVSAHHHLEAYDFMAVEFSRNLEVFLSVPVSLRLRSVCDLIAWSCVGIFSLTPMQRCVPKREGEWECSESPFAQFISILVLISHTIYTKNNILLPSSPFRNSLWHSEGGNPVAVALSWSRMTKKIELLCTM